MEKLATLTGNGWAEYHRGFLAADREKDASVAAKANDVWDQYEKGSLNLLQMRHGPLDYSYLYRRRAA